MCHTVDESTHQIPSNDVVFLTFYHFPYTTEPPTSTMLMQPSPTIVQSFAQSPPTIPIAPSVRYHIGDLPYDLWTTLLYFSFLSLFSFTWRILSWPDQSQVISPCGRDLTIHFATHEPCARFTYCLYLRLLYLLQKTREFSPELRLKFISSHHFTLLCLAPSIYLTLSTHFALSHHAEPSSHTTLHSLILRQETISLLSNHTPQNHIGYTLRSPSPLIFVAS